MVLFANGAFLMERSAPLPSEAGRWFIQGNSLTLIHPHGQAHMAWPLEQDPQWHTLAARRSHLPPKLYFEGYVSLRDDALIFRDCMTGLEYALSEADRALLLRHDSKRLGWRRAVWVALTGHWQDDIRRRVPSQITITAVHAVAPQQRCKTQLALPRRSEGKTRL
ncbi:hypothetical protein GCM10023333_10770 [Ferrimonas pelagia]|uniref:Uncharacterized protein n=1 Tax=Ferrimonas pelagia TaxID=1177826 RepID=A0ABP9EHE0_9GAMM